MSEGTPIRHLLEVRGISIQAIGLISVNGSLGRADYTLRDLDDIQLYHLLEGG